MKIVAHPSPLVLETELLDRVAAAKSSDPLAPVLIVVPSRRLAVHLSRRLAERFGAILGVSVLHHAAVAERVLEAAGVGPGRVVDDDLLDTLFARVLGRAAAGPLRDFARDRPGASSALRATLTDLRESGIDTAAVTATLSGLEAETAALYGRWTAALQDIRARAGATDAAGLATEAAAHAGVFAARFAAILHHGAYDLIGVHVDLVRALDRGRELTFLLPADVRAPSGAFGVERARSIAEGSGPIESLDRPFAPAPADCFNAHGAPTELQTAAYGALAAVAAGTPPAEVAIVVRSFGPYAAALDALLDGDGPRWHTSYTRPLRRDPGIAEALRAIAAADDRGPRSFGSHADAFETIAREAAGGDRLLRLFATMRDVETWLAPGREVSRREALAWLDARADAATLPPGGAEGGGVRILDAMQARGLTFGSLGLVGMNAGVFPRMAREDPFLSDASRAHLREATGRPLPIASESDGEERLLLAMLLASARDQLRVSWRRADESGRPLVPSSALPAIARFTGIGSDAMAVERAASAIPAHPRSRIAACMQTYGLLHRADETLLVALASETGADAGAAVAARRPELAAGIALVAATDAFGSSTGAYDGRVGAGLRRESMAATSLERLGRCPLQFFFRDVLRVDAPRTPTSPFEADAASTGTRVHDVLREVYARLREERAFEGGDVAARVVRARALLREAWKANAGEEASARAAHLPLLDRIEGVRWLRALDAFLEADLARIADEGLVPESLEHEVDRVIPQGPEGLLVRARFDRVLRGPKGAVVGDYKTGGGLSARVNSRAMLSGAALQVPIYALVSGSPVELLGVGPRSEARVVRFEGFDSPEERDGVLETLRIVAALAATGRFPLRSGGHCAWCDYRSACRRGHPPTEFRETEAEDTRDARDCWSKTDKAPSLPVPRGDTTP